MSVEPLAIAHPIGQHYEQRNRQLVREFARAHDREYFVTCGPVVIDGGLLNADRELTGVCEAKWRTDMTRADLRTRGDTYLITAEKLTNLMRAARTYHAQGLLVVRLADDTRWWWHLCDETGRQLVPWLVRYTRTRATSLGPETTERDNAYVPMRYARPWS